MQATVSALGHCLPPAGAPPLAIVLELLGTTIVAAAGTLGVVAVVAVATRGRAAFPLARAAAVVALSAAVAFLLKLVFREPRPPGACLQSYGMPSGHAAAATAIVFEVGALVRAAAAAREAAVAAAQTAPAMQRALARLRPPRPLLAAGVFYMLGLWHAAAVYSRVHARYHTLGQVAGGAAVALAVTIAADVLDMPIRVALAARARGGRVKDT